MTNVDTQRQEEVFKDDPSIRFAVKWIEANQDKLEGRVFYPPIISLNVPDQRYAWQIEAMMNNATRKVRLSLARSVPWLTCVSRSSAKTSMTTSSS